jgi:hypothetical protein
MQARAYRVWKDQILASKTRERLCVFGKVDAPLKDGTLEIEPLLCRMTGNMETSTS